MQLNHRSAPLRFIVGVVASWVSLRAGMTLLPLLLPEPVVQVVAMPPSTVEMTFVPPIPPAKYLFVPAAEGRPVLSAAMATPTRRRVQPSTPMLVAYQPIIFEGPLRASYVRWVDQAPAAWPRVTAAEPNPVSQLVAEPAERRWSGSAWAYARQGSGPRPLAGGGQLGGSQFGVRIAYAVTPHVAVAARGYAAIGQAGREVAVGGEWHPVPGLRLAAERRFAADRAGRDAFSAYAAGGFWHETHGLVADGYAQAGIVGVRSHDLFADGALRVGRRIGSATLGGGIWAAAQPGAERIDVGPRAAMRLGSTPVSLAVEQRFRIAGSVNPGSGLAVTLGADF